MAADRAAAHARGSLTVIVEEGAGASRATPAARALRLPVYFTDALLGDYARQAVGQATLNLGARRAPAAR